MSGPVRHRRPARRLVRRAAGVAAVLVLTAALAVALQVREVRVLGARRFPAHDVENALRPVLGSPALAARAGTLRARVREIPWVADATVTVSLDGVVTCTVAERVPVAVALDTGARRLVDGSGRLLGSADSAPGLLELDGFAPYPEERAALLSAVPALESAWGARLERAERVGPHDAALHFAGAAAVVLADPDRAPALADARRVLVAWPAALPAPLRLDARVRGRWRRQDGDAPPDPEEG